MSLTKYREKRDFGRTAEPRGSAKHAPAAAAKFVVQKHDASHLHYDFRLQIGGVLKSWAVPKGPSLDPAQKRLAVEVEDHPLEYGGFEGVIPAGQYGGGTVMLWDRGTWQPEGDAAADYRAGKLKFELHGQKLRGKWMLLRRGGSQAAKPQWLLFKLRDAEARAESDFSVTGHEPLSVATGRDMETIAADKNRLRRSRRKAHDPPAATNGRARGRKSATAKSHGETAESDKAKAKVARARRPHRAGAKSDPFPRVVDAELPTLVPAAPDGDDWLHEMKFDGYRMVAWKDDAKVRFETRNHLDWTRKVRSLAQAIGRLNVERAIFDGEVVAFDDRGISNFQLLQNAFRDPQAQRGVYIVFDLIYLDGVDLRGRPLQERKAELARLKLPTDRGPLRVSDFMIGHGPKVFAEARRSGLEGIVSKRRQSPYVGGRTTDWLKIKCQERSEFVIGGFTEPGGSRKGFGALLLGLFDDHQRLKYAGRVGTGFSRAVIDELAPRLEAITRRTSPFVDSLPAAHARGVHWVRPRLVAQVAFSNWTADHLLRHPSFQGLREDKPARAVHPEKPKPIAVAATGGNHAAPRRRAPAAAKGAADETMLAGVRLTHPDRILFPAEKITKRELAEYYLAVAERMLPEVAGRPLAIVRCPDGLTGSRFFQKHPPTAAPKAMHRVEIREKSRTATYLMIEDVGDLVGLVQIAALEIHAWGSRTHTIEKPDRLVFDLDPAPEVKWPAVIAAACELRDFLTALGLESFAKISGGKGIHLVVPLRRAHDWPQVADFARAVAQAVERAAPDRYTAVLSKRARVGKIFVDYLRNQRGATSIASYSTRARDGAPVAAPVSWRELPRIDRPDPFNIRSMLSRLRTLRHDPWQGVTDVAQTITQAMLRKLR